MAARTVTDHAAATELRLYIENDRRTYEQHYLEVVRNLQRHRARGRYDHERAIVGMGHAVEMGARAYVREHCAPGTVWHDIFNAATRWECATELVDQLEAEWECGNEL